MPGGFEIRGIAFAKFKGYPKWPVRIVDTVQKKNGSHYAVFCYGTHEVLTVSEYFIERFFPLRQNNRSIPNIHVLSSICRKRVIRINPELH